VLLSLVGGTASAQDLVISPFINKIHISGNHSIGTKELEGQMRLKEPSFFAIFNKPRFSNAVLRRDLAHLEGYYHAVGFFDARVTLDRVEPSSDGRFVDVYMVVDEGRPTLVESVTFSENSLIPTKELARGLLLEEGEPYNASLLTTDIYTIRTRYFNRGYLGVAIEDSVRIDDYKVWIRFDIEPGTQITISDIVVTGNESVKPGVVEKEFAFKTGEVCRLDKLLETQRNLYETGLFTVVDIAPVNLDPLDRTVDLNVRLRERKPAYVEAGFGVGNVVGSRVTGEWGTRNIFGSGRTLRARVEYAYDLFRGERVDFGNMQFDNIFYRYDIVFGQRRVFGSKVNLGLNVFLEKDGTVPDLVVKTLGGAVGGSRRLGLHTETFGSFTISEIERQATDLPVVESNSHILATSASHDLRDFILNPQTGAYRIARGQVGGGILGGLNDFYTLTGSLQRYHRIRPGWVFAWRLRAGWGDAYGRSDSTGVPVEQRYFLGGGNSVRGYNENVLGPRTLNPSTQEFQVSGGEFLLLGNLELRTPVPVLSRWNFSGAIFLDTGNVWEDIATMQPEDFRLSADVDDVTVEDYRYSVGLGIRYNTPVGPIRLDYGWPLKQSTYLDDSGRFHITLGQIF